MDVAIIGSRTFDDYDRLKLYMNEVKSRISRIISGGARGADTLGKRWAVENHIPYKEFPADWGNLTVPGAVVKTSTYGRKYNANAGFDRNKQMAHHLKEHRGVCVAFYDGSSHGTKQMIDYCTSLGVEVFVIDTNLELVE